MFCLMLYPQISKREYELDSSLEVRKIRTGDKLIMGGSLAYVNKMTINGPFNTKCPTLLHTVHHKLMKEVF